MCAPLTFDSASCGNVPLYNATLTMCFLATSVALVTAAVTSAPFALPTPTRFLRSPTTTSARKRNLRPPFTTRATRSMCNVRSSNCFSSGTSIWRRPRLTLSGVIAIIKTPIQLSGLRPRVPRRGHDIVCHPCRIQHV